MLSLIILLAAPVTPESARVDYATALEQVDASPEVSQANAAATLRKEGPRPGFFTSNPQLTAQPGFRTEAGQGGVEGQLTLQQSLNLNGLGAARVAVVERDADVARLEHRVLRQERRIAVSNAWLTLWAAQEGSRIAHEEETVAQELVDRLVRATATGASTKVELATAKSFAAEAAALHLDWEGRRVEAGAELADLLGLSEIAEATGPLPPAASLTGGELSTLKVEKAKRDLEAEQARAAEVTAQWGPQLQVSLQGGHEATAQWFGNVGLGLTLPVFEHGRREETAHRATIARLEGELTAQERRARVRRQLAEHEVEHSAEVLQLLETRQLPASEEAATLEARRFAAGEATLLELSLLRRQALTARIATALARARALAARRVLHELETAP